MVDYDYYTERRDKYKERVSQILTSAYTEYYDQGFFREWFDSSDAECAFAAVLIKILKDIFGEHINNDMEKTCWMYAKNLSNSLQTYIELQKKYKLNDVIKFSEIFLTKQLNNLDTDLNLSEFFTSEYDDENPI